MLQNVAVIADTMSTVSGPTYSRHTPPKIHVVIVVDIDDVKGRSSSKDLDWSNKLMARRTAYNDVEKASNL